MDLREIKNKHDERHETGIRWKEPTPEHIFGIDYLEVVIIPAPEDCRFLHSLPNGYQALSDAMQGDLILATRDSWPFDTPPGSKDFWHDIAGREGLFGES